jgi:hypothetical protein
MKRTLIFAALTTAAVTLPAAAFAGGLLDIGVNLGGPRYYAPAPVEYAPAPVVVEQPTVVYQQEPTVVYETPAPAYGPPVVYNGYYSNCYWDNGYRICQ